MSSYGRSISELVLRVLVYSKQIAPGAGKHLKNVRELKENRRAAPLGYRPDLLTEYKPLGLNLPISNRAASQCLQ